MTAGSNASKNYEANMNLKSTEKVIMKNNVSKIVTPTSFVRLSDLNNCPSSTESLNSSFKYTKAKPENSYRLNCNVTETSWVESKLTISSRTSDTLNKAVNKKLSSNIVTATDYYDEFGNEGDAEAIISESDLSSLQSSMGRSGQGKIFTIKFIKLSMQTCFCIKKKIIFFIAFFITDRLNKMTI